MGEGVWRVLIKRKASCYDRLKIQCGEIHVGSSSRYGYVQSHAHGSRTLWEASKPADRGVKVAGPRVVRPKQADQVAAGNLNFTTECCGWLDTFGPLATGVVDVGTLDASET